jgi:hypothetical protein
VLDATARLKPIQIPTIPSLKKKHKPKKAGIPSKLYEAKLTIEPVCCLPLALITEAPTPCKVSKITKILKISHARFISF